MEKITITLTRAELESLVDILTDIKYDVAGCPPEPEILDSLIYKTSGHL